MHLRLLYLDHRQKSAAAGLPELHSRWQTIHERAFDKQVKRDPSKERQQRAYYKHGPVLQVQSSAHFHHKLDHDRQGRIVHEVDRIGSFPQEREYPWHSDS